MVTNQSTARPPPSSVPAAHVTDSAAPPGNSLAHTRPSHTARAARFDSLVAVSHVGLVVAIVAAVVGVAAVAAAEVAAAAVEVEVAAAADEVEVAAAVVAEGVGSAMFAAAAAARVFVAVVVRCTFAVAFLAAAAVVVAVRAPRRRNRKSRFRRQTRLMAVLVDDKRIAAGGTVGWKLGVGAAAMRVAGRWCLTVVVRGLGMAVMVVARRGIGRMVVEVLDCIARGVAAVLTDIRRRSEIAVCCTRPMEQHFLCSSSRPRVRSRHRMVCLGRDLAWDVVLARADHTWHRLGCMCSIVSPQACGHSIGRRRKAWREDRAGCLHS
jgi:hypothetical protein